MYKNNTKQAKSQEGKNSKTKSFQELKQLNIKIAEMIAQIDSAAGFRTKRAENMLDCGTNILFGVCPNDGYRHVVAANFCKNRFCPICARRRQRRFYRDSLVILENINSSNKYEFIFLTLTLENCPGGALRDTLTLMQKAFDRLMKRREIKKQVKGYIKALEINYNEDRQDYHPHFHILLIVEKSYFKNGNFITLDRYIQLWRDSLQINYLPNVDIRKTYNSAKKSASELVKYSLKPGDIEKIAVLKTLDKALEGKRCISFGGLAAEYKRKLKIADVESKNADLTDGATIYCPHCGAKTQLELSQWDFGANKYVSEQL